jgi:hypothetical protein
MNMRLLEPRLNKTQVLFTSSISASTDIDPLRSAQTLAKAIQDLGLLLNLHRRLHLDRSIDTSCKLLLRVLDEKGYCWEGWLAPI